MISIETAIKSELYYDQDGITVQRATRADAEYVAFNMRRPDVDECWYADHKTPSQAVQDSIEKTAFCLSVRRMGVPICLFGVNGENVIGTRGIIWLLGTDDIKKIGLRFVRHSRYFVDIMLGFYPYLYNYVYEGNTISIDWLRMLGAKFVGAEVYGVEKKMFRYFCFERGA